MIRHLSIRNYALIDELDIDLSSGLTTITGETGSGKSIIIGALKLILGERADTKALKDTDQKCIIEGTFDISGYDVKPLFLKYDLDYENETTIRREISPTGKSRAFINDTPVNLAQLTELAEQLVDIHSQHETLVLNSTAFQARLLDTYAGNGELSKQYASTYKRYKKLSGELEQLLEQDRQAKLDFDYFKFQLNELQEIDLDESKLGGAEDQLKQLEHAEDIKTALNAALNGLEHETGGIVSDLRAVVNQLSGIKDITEAYGQAYERLNSALIELEDLRTEIEGLDDAVDLDPEKAEQLKEQLSAIYILQQKHRVNSIAELVEVRDILSHKIESVANLDERIKQTEEELKEAESEAKDLAKQISNTRSAAISPLSNEVMGILSSLNMSEAEPQIALTPTETLNALGIDEIRFLFKTNKGGEFKPLKNIASGGELSRLMMALKAIMTRTAKLPTIIFDEIDTGVSGEVADKMGAIMQEMSGNMQVISITHLPQIAGKGVSHFKVSKDESGDASITKIEQLNDEQRIIEIAQMLSGEQVTEAAIENARNLLQA